VLPLALPSLRHRREDIPLLANHLIERHAAALGRGQVTFSARVIEKLISYGWPGNVRELENVIHRALVVSGGPVLQPEMVDLPDAALNKAGLTFKQQKARALKEFEHHYLREMLAQSEGNVSQAARAANKDRRSFTRLLRKHNLGGLVDATCPN